MGALLKTSIRTLESVNREKIKSPSFVLKMLQLIQAVCAIKIKWKFHKHERRILSKRTHYTSNPSQKWRIPIPFPGTHTHTHTHTHLTDTCARKRMEERTHTHPGTSACSLYPNHSLRHSPLTDTPHSTLTLKYSMEDKSTRLKDLYKKNDVQRYTAFHIERMF